MSIIELKEHINRELKKLKETIEGKKPNENSPDFMSNVINVYASVFDKLLGTKQTPGYTSHLNKETVAFYLETLSDLLNMTEDLPLNQKSKGVILNRINDACDLNLLRQLDLNNFDKEKYANDLKNKILAPFTDTVEIRTWGTVLEINNGFGTMIEQFFQNSNFGHASVAMKFLANEEGLNLIKTYCLNDDGSIKIPFKIMTHGQDTICEVYWSFWPFRLQTMEQDLRDIQNKQEYLDDSETLRLMPLELKTHYFQQKYVRTVVPSFLGSTSTKHIFQSKEQNHRTQALPPAAMIDISELEPDVVRRNYLNLKVQQYNLEEKIASLKTLRNNYLISGKDYAIGPEEPAKLVKPNSNFLVLLRRFNAQHPGKLMSEIIASKTISKNQSSSLLDAVNEIIKSENGRLTELSEQVDQAARLISGHEDTIHNLKREITHLVFQDFGEKEDIAILNCVDVELKKAVSEKKAYTFPENYLPIFEPFTKILAPEFLTTEINYDDVERVKTLIIRCQSRSVHNQEDIDMLSDVYNKLNKIDSAEKPYIFSGDDLRFFERFRELITSEFLTEIEYDDIKCVEALITKSKERIDRERKETGQELMKKNEELVQLYNNKDEHGADHFITELKNIDNRLLFIEECSQQLALEKSFPIFIKCLNEDGTVYYEYIKNPDEFKKFNDNLMSENNNLLSLRDKSEYGFIVNKLQSKVSFDELNEKKIHRGSSKSVILGNFDIEKMLKKASELALAHKNFGLLNENCSTTSMKILHAGAPENQKIMFEWHQVKDNETIASNTFITNPQAVYSAAKIVALANNDDEKALKMIANKKKHKVDHRYYFLVNSVFNQHMKAPSGNGIISSILNLLFYISLLPYLFKLYCDMVQSTKFKEQQEDSLPAKVAREIKRLNQDSYLLIHAAHPALALHRMASAMNAQATKIPFFDTDTLALVELYRNRLNLESDENSSLSKSNVQRILDERKARIDVITNAMSTGDNVEAILNDRPESKTPLEWEMTEKERIESLVKHFVLYYQELRSRKPLVIFRSNFTRLLDAQPTDDEKLQAIVKHIKESPNSRSATAYAACLENDPILKNKIENEVPSCPTEPIEVCNGPIVDL